MNLSLMLAALAIILILFVVTVVTLFLKRRTAKLDVAHFRARWSTLQKSCASQATWPLAVIDADKLLDEALKKSHYKGKTMGERLVSAQRDINDNDSAWFAHKLRNKIVHEEVNLHKRDVQTALRGFRDALRDLGAL
jgi:hypothetical protein